MLPLHTYLRSFSLRGAEQTKQTEGFEDKLQKAKEAAAFMDPTIIQ